MAEELTGRRRLRTLKRFMRDPVFVLQVEVRHYGDRTEYGCPSIDIVHYDFTEWRDARAEDGLSLETSIQKEGE